MLRATHINMTLSVWLWTLILSNSFSIHLFFAWLYAIIQDWDHHRWHFANVFWFSLPFKHRWFTHTLLFVILIMLLINISIFTYKMWFDLWKIFNYNNLLSFLNESKTDNMFLFLLLHWHLIWDFLTKRWIPYFYPFLKWNIWLWLFTTWENKNGNLTWEMILSFFHSILNIFMIWFIIVNYQHFYSIIEPKVKWLLSNDIQVLIIFFLLQLIFIWFLFMKDIKNYIWNFKDFAIRLLKVITYSIIWIIISLILIWILYIFNINLSTIMYNLSNWYIYINWLNLYFILFITMVYLWYSLYLTKKYLVSIASTIAYIINVTYIILSLFLLSIIWII